MLCSRYRRTREEVYAVPAPAFTKSWHPISHGSLIDLVTSSLDSYGLRVWKSDFGMTKDTQQMFAVLDLQLPHGLYQTDFTMSIGVRNSLDKTIAASVAIGNRVFVCDNLAFSGEVLFSKKHHPNIEVSLPRKIDRAIEKFITKFQQEDMPQILAWKQAEVTFQEGTNFICKLAEVGALPIAGILICRKYFKEQKHPELQARNAWSLFNSTTQFMRDDRQESNPVTLQEQSLLLWKAFSDEWPKI